MSDPTNKPVAAYGAQEAATLFLAERKFLAASVAVWREIDKHIDDEGRYKRGVPTTLTTDAELRRVEREAWQQYRRFLDLREALNAAD